MTRDEAIQVLGLPLNASGEDIHRRLTESEFGTLPLKQRLAIRKALWARSEIAKPLTQTEVRDLPVSLSPGRHFADRLSHTHEGDLPREQGRPTASLRKEDTEASQESSPVTVSLGQVLAGRFEIRRLVGRGGMGIVFAAFDRTRREEVALTLKASVDVRSMKDDMHTWTQEGDDLARDGQIGAGVQVVEGVSSAVMNFARMANLPIGKAHEKFHAAAKEIGELIHDQEKSPVPGLGTAAGLSKSAGSAIDGLDELKEVAGFGEALPKMSGLTKAGESLGLAGKALSACDEIAKGNIVGGLGESSDVAGELAELAGKTKLGAIAAGDDFAKAYESYEKGETAESVAGGLKGVSKIASSLGVNPAENLVNGGIDAFRAVKRSADGMESFREAGEVPAST